MLYHTEPVMASRADSVAYGLHGYQYWRRAVQFLIRDGCVRLCLVVLSYHHVQLMTDARIRYWWLVVGGGLVVDVNGH